MPKTVLASAWKRLFAFIFDFIIIDLVILYPFTNITERVFSSASIWSISLSKSIMTLVLVVSVFYLLYFLLFEWLLGQTIGKMLMRIVSVSFDDKRMSFIQAFGRNLFIFPVIPLVFLWAIDPIFIIWRRISLSEMLTKTKTVEAQKWKTG